ncbi:LysR family transcriptional regulator [Alteromonadaceae bacterium M269]|nr:LysR family transcriptional regulator [Alteromonadaceae bacterium M269]
MKRTIFSILPTTFVAVVEQGSITRAAEELGLAKSAVSQNLKRLEEQVGVKLAVRTTRQFSLTPAGERYFELCKDIVALSKRADSEMELYGADPAGSIKITAPHAMISPVIAPTIAELVRLHPNLQPELVADDKRLDIAGEGIDVAITIGELKDSNLKARRVGIMEDVLCVSKQFIHSQNKPISIDSILDVQEFPYIAHEREHVTERGFQLQNVKRTSLNLKFDKAYTVNTANAMLALCREGLGVAMLPSFAISEDLKSGELVQLFPEYSLGQTPIYAVHPYDKYVPASVSAFIDAVKTKLGG